MCPTNVTEWYSYSYVYIKNHHLSHYHTFICIFINWSKYKKSLKYTRFDALVLIIELPYSLLLSYTTSIHLRQYLVQVSPGLANSGAGINNWLLFVIIEQLLSTNILWEFFEVNKTKMNKKFISKHVFITHLGLLLP